MRYKSHSKITLEEKEQLRYEKTSIQQQIEKTVNEHLQINNEQFETKEANKTNKQTTCFSAKQSLL